jgi:tetratricopeptide (TPR) repeat protein
MTASWPWGDDRLVVLAGAGISAITPSDVPSWWHFNTTVLERIVALAMQDLALAPETVETLHALTIDDVGVALFSELAADSIAGDGWFWLLRHLDGTVPAQCHDALAQLAADGRLAAIVTTNFDTLIEQAFADAGVPLDIHLPGAGPPAPLTGDGPCRLLKVHGSVGDAQSLVDLTSQKLRGLPQTTRRWLMEAFAEHPVLVAGFSGADLQLADDYLGLHAAAPHTPWLRWISRGGRLPLAEASAVIDATPAGAFVEGELPDVLATVGIPVPPARAAARTAPASPASWVDDWLVSVAASPSIAAAACARLLDVAGHPVAAASVRAAVREAIVAAMRDGVSVVDGLQFSHALALFGNDELSEDAEQAVADLDLSQRLVAAILPRIEAGLSERAQIEQHLNAAGVLENLAAARLALDEVDEAADLLQQAKAHVDALPPDLGANRRAAAWMLSGAIHFARDDRRQALLDYRTAGMLARASGNASLQLHALENRKRLAVTLGEVDLARLLHEDIVRLRALVPSAVDTSFDLDFDWPDEARTAVFDQLLARMRTEARHGGDRLDEALYSLWCVVEAVPAKADALREALADVPAEATATLRPEAHALLKIARHTLAADDDVTLLDDVPRALTAWAAVQFGPGGRVTPLEDGLVLHPRLRTAVEGLANRWAQTGISRFQAGKWDEAHVQFTVGGSAFLLAGAHDLAIRALLYATDAQARLGEHAQASAQLAYLAREAGPGLTGQVLTRQLRTLVHAVAGDLAEPPTALESAAPIMHRIERLGDAAEIGSAALSMAQLHHMAGDNDAAVALARRALGLLTDPAHQEVARQALEQFSAAAGEAPDVLQKSD